MRVLAEWEGRVLEVTTEYVVAVVVDQLDRNIPEEEAVIPLDQISDSDRDLVIPGALFNWSIRYHDQRSAESMIRFHRLPRWTIEEVENARRLVASSRLF